MREFFGYEDLIFAFDAQCKRTMIDVSRHTGRFQERSKAISLNSIEENLKEFPLVGWERHKA